MFSIVMPLYNKANEVRTSIDAVLRQTVSELELLIVNDGSTDQSRQIAASINDSRIRIINQDNAGVSAARNRGIKEARYDYFAFLDADDYWEDDFLARIKSLIQRYPQAGAYATAYLFDDGVKQRSARIYGLKDKPLLITDYFAVASRGDLPLMASGICIPRAVFRKIGKFPENQKQGEDQDLWARIGLEYPIAVDPGFCVHYVLSAENRVSRQSIPQQELAYSRALQNKLDNNQIPDNKRDSVARYIAGHLLHLARLNIHAGRLQLCRALLNDSRSKRILFRWLKCWVFYFVSRCQKNPE